MKFGNLLFRFIPNKPEQGKCTIEDVERIRTLTGQLSNDNIKIFAHLLMTGQSSVFGFNKFYIFAILIRIT